MTADAIPANARATVLQTRARARAPGSHDRSISRIESEATRLDRTEMWVRIDQQTADGNAPSVIPPLPDRLMGVTGLSDLMHQVADGVIKRATTTPLANAHH